MAIRKILACLILLAVGSAQPALAASCINGHPTVEQEFRSARYVVVGTTTTIKKNVPVRLSYQNGFYNSRVMIQTVTIHKQYRGPMRRTITYKDEYSSSQFPMTLGKKYVLFYRKRGDDELYIDVCGNSQEIKSFNSQILRKLAKIRDRN